MQSEEQQPYGEGWRRGEEEQELPPLSPTPPPKKPTTEEEEYVSQLHLKLCLRLAKLETIEKCQKTPQIMKMAEIKACGQRIEYLERGATQGCCRNRNMVTLCSCCNPKGIEFPLS
jgi:hypothetical protein